MFETSIFCDKCGCGFSFPNVEPKWFMTERYLDSEIDFERGAHPKIVRCKNEVNEKHRIVLAWRPLPEPYRPERSEGE